MPTVVPVVLGLGDMLKPLSPRGHLLQFPQLFRDGLVRALAMDAVLGVCRYPNLKVHAVVLSADRGRAGHEIRGADPYRRSAVFQRAQHRSRPSAGGVPM